MSVQTSKRASYQILRTSWAVIISLFLVAPSIVTHPTNQTVETGGDSVTFRVVATTATNFQWFFKGSVISDTTTNITGSNTNMLSIMFPLLENGGEYFVRVSNSIGTEVDSDRATLTVECKLQSCRLHV